MFGANSQQRGGNLLGFLLFWLLHCQVAKQALERYKNDYSFNKSDINGFAQTWANYQYMDLFLF